MIGSRTRIECPPARNTPSLSRTSRRHGHGGCTSRTTGSGDASAISAAAVETCTAGEAAICRGPRRRTHQRPCGSPPTCPGSSPAAVQARRSPGPSPRRPPAAAGVRGRRAPVAARPAPGRLRQLSPAQCCRSSSCVCARYHPPGGPAQKRILPCGGGAAEMAGQLIRRAFIQSQQDWLTSAASTRLRRPRAHSPSSSSSCRRGPRRPPRPLPLATGPGPRRGHQRRGRQRPPAAAPGGVNPAQHCLGLGLAQPGAVP